MSHVSRSLSTRFQVFVLLRTPNFIIFHFRVLALPKISQMYPTTRYVFEFDYRYNSLSFGPIFHKLSHQLCIRFRMVSTSLSSLSTDQKYITMILSISNGQTEYRELLGIDGKQIRITIGYITAPMGPMPSGLDTLADDRS